jgi:hypothetical protein
LAGIVGRESTVLIVTSGGAVLALWLHVRLGERRPRSLRAAVVHAILAGALLGVLPQLLDVLIGEEPSHRADVAALLGIFLPIMTYMFLASLYVIEQLQRRLYAR